jgi:hypothetical protein
MAEIQFSEERHEYLVAGRRWPGVTEVLDPINELDGIPRDVLRAAAEFGRHVHLACHLSNLGTLDRATLDPALVPYLAGWEQFLSDTGARVIESERMVKHHALRYCGTVDAVIEWRDRRHVVDIKTSAAVPRTVGPQTAAYRDAYVLDVGALSPKRFCCHLIGDGTYRLIPLNERSDFDMFVSCLNIHRWRNRK